MTDARSESMRAFVRAAGWGTAALRPLSGDASNRRYLRLERTGETAVLMDAPPERGEDIRPFVAMTEWLLEQGFSAPGVHAADPTQGFLLLEDLGDDLFARHLEHAPQDELALYRRAVDLLVALAHCPVPRMVGDGDCRVALPPYDRAVLDREAGLIVEWWMPAATANRVGPDLAAEFFGLLHAATAMVEPSREATVLRDYHAENLLWLPDRPGLRAVGLLDYQDALAGHPAYDLMSLLEDARRDTPRDMQAAMVAHYLASRPEIDAPEFQAAYAALGAQRNLKIIGIFTRLAVRDGKPQYLSLIPRVWGHLMHDLSAPGLEDLAAWVGRHVPAPAPGILDAIAARSAA